MQPFPANDLPKGGTVQEKGRKTRFYVWSHDKFQEEASLSRNKK